MRLLAGNPVLGLVGLGVWSLVFVAMDGITSAAEAGSDAPDWVTLALGVVGAAGIPLVVLGQRESGLPRRWRIANTIALIDAGLLLLFAAGHWIDVLARPADYWKPGWSPGAIGLLIVLATAIAQPAIVQRARQPGLIAGVGLGVFLYAGLLITTKFSSAGPRDFTAPMLLIPAVFSAIAGLVAYELGSRLRVGGSGS